MRLFGVLLVIVFSSSICYANGDISFNNYTNANSVQRGAILVEGNDYLWVGSGGGLVRWNLKNNTYQNYINSDGLSDNCVRSILIDNDGKKWFATNNGISCYDGISWTRYSKEDGLADNYVEDLAIDKNGTIWAATGLGVCSFNGVRWDSYSVADGAPRYLVKDISVDPTADMGIWFGTIQEGVFHFNGSEWINYNRDNSPLQSNRMVTLEVDADGNLWLAVKTTTPDPYRYTGLVKFDGTNWEYHLENADIQDIEFDSNGDVWVCAASDGVYHYKNNTEWVGYYESDGLLNSFVKALDFAENGILFIGSIEGVSVFDGSSWTYLVTEGGLKGEIVLDIKFDTENNAWIGTYWGGVNVFNGSNWQYYTSKNGLAGDWVNSIAIDKDGRKWFATNDWGGGGLSVLDGSSFTYYRTENGLSDSWVNDIAIDQNDYYWFGTGRTWDPMDGGVNLFDRATWTVYNVADGLADKVVQCVHIDTSGNKWFGTQNNGISVFDGAHWTTYNTANGLACNDIRYIAQDNNGWMWVATWGGGLNVFDGADWQVYNTSNGLVSDNINTVLVDKQSSVWVGTDNYGLGKYDGNSWEYFTTVDGLPTNEIFSLALDNNENLWIGGRGSSLSRLLVNKFPVADAGEDKIAFVERSTVFDGSLSYDPDGSIVSYTWDFDAGVDSNDDGNFINDVDATGASVSYTYNEPGTYLVTLTVTDDKGSTSTDQVEIGVSSVPAPVIVLQTPTISLGIIEVGTSDSTTFTIVNSGLLELVISEIISDNPAFTVDPPSATVPVGDSVTVTIRFNITSAIDDSATISISSNDPSTPVTLIPVIFIAVTPPMVTSIEPSYVYQKAVDSVITITGENFMQGAKVVVGGGGVLVTQTTVIDSQHLSAKLTVASSASPGLRDISVINPDGGDGMGIGLLEVRQIPQVFEVKPLVLEAGADSAWLVVSGSGFTQDISAGVSGGGVSVLGVEYRSSRQVAVLVSVASDAAAGRRNLTLTVSGVEVVVSAVLEVRSNQPPEITVPTDWTINEGEQLTFVIHASDPEGGPLTYQTSTLPAGASFQGVAFTWRPDYEQAGSYSVQFTVADQLGATDQQTVSITVANTNRSPKLYKLSNQKVTSGQVMSFTIAAGDPDGESLVLRTTGLPTGAVITPATDTTFSFSWTPIDDDAGTFRTEFVVADPAGATDRQSVGLTVDVPAKPVNLPPVFVDTASLMALAEGAVLDLVVAAVDSNLTTPVIYIQSLPQNADFDPVTSRFTFHPDYKQAGSYTFLFIATDGSLTASRKLTVMVAETDVAPVMPPMEAVEIAEGERFSLTIDAVDLGGDALIYEADSLPAGASLDPLTGTLLFAPDYTQQGEYAIVLRAKDPAGNFAEDTLALSVKNTNQAPVLTYISDQIVQTNDTLMLLASAVDPDGDSLSFQFTSSLPDGTLFDPASQIFTFVAGGGTDTLEGVFIVSDEAGLSDSQKVTISVVATENQPPVIGQLAARHFFSEGDTISIQVSATDPEADNLSFGIANTDKLPLAMRQISADGLYRFVADYTLAGRYEVTFQVSDGSLNSTVQVEIDIENVNRPPVIEPVGDRQAAEGEQLTFSFAISDPDGDDLSVGMSGLPRGASCDKQTGAFSFTPDYDQAGVYYLGVTVSDGQASATDNFTMVVANTNRAPLLRRVKDPEVVEGQLIEFELEADDPDGDSAWVVIDTSRVPFLGDAMQKIARLRNGRSFFFDTAKLVGALRIPSAVLAFYAEDEHGARSQEEIVDIAIIRKALAQIKDLPPGLEKKLDMLEEYGVGVQIAIQNNSDQDLSVDLEVSERSGRAKRGKKEDESVASLLAGLTDGDDKVKNDDPYADYRYTYLSGSGGESAFYGIRRGWGLDLSQLPTGTGISVVFRYTDEDLPLEIENFDEANLRLYGLDNLTGEFVLIENAVVNTDSNTVAFTLSSQGFIEYTLGVELSASDVPDIQTLNLDMLVENVVVETGRTTNTAGPYVVRAFAPTGAVVSLARLYYRTDGLGDYQAAEMTKIEGERYGYEASVAGLPEGGTIEYYVEMFANFELVSSPLQNPQENPHELRIITGLIGDVSGDGVVNIFDLLDLLKVLAGKVEASELSDCDQNGKMNIFDLVEFFRILKNQ